MKGAVLIAFNELIESTAGISTWEALLETVKPDSLGVYTSVESYPDEELFSLVNAYSLHTGIDTSDLVSIFGRFLFDALNDKYPQFSQQQNNFFDFIKSIDGTIHKEVYKLYQNANLPTISCEQLSEHELILLYRSPRKLCLLAEGLIAGAADYYEVVCSLEHKRCLHRDDDACELILTLT